MLFVEGNHFCPGCEKSGNCQLQALAYDSEMMTPHFVEFFPDRPVDASHPDVLLDFNRCILCELCVRASRDVDGKYVFALAGRGHGLAHRSSIRRPASSATRTSRSPTRPRTSVPVGAILDQARRLRRRRSASAATTSSRSARKRRAARWRRRSERARRKPRASEGPARDDFARRLLRLPHVVPRHRRAHSRTRRRSPSSTARR